MALDIKNPEVERLVVEVAKRDVRASIFEFLEREIWPSVPKALRGKAPTKAEREAILGYGRDGA